MMNVLDLVKKYGQGKGEEKMWASMAVLSEALEPMKEADADGYWCMMRKMYGAMSDGHYNEEFAMYDVAHMAYTNRAGERKTGGYWTAEQVDEATKGYKFPAGVNKWDKYVAFNAMRADLCKKMDDAQVIDAAWLFYFADEDWPNESATKIWDYMCLKYSK